MKKHDSPADPIEALDLQERVALAPGLEFPDAPDFVSRPSRIPLDRMLSLTEQHRLWFPPTQAMIAQRTRRKCGVEFVL